MYRRHPRLGACISGFTNWKADFKDIAYSGYMPSYIQVTSRFGKLSSKTLEDFEIDTKQKVGVIIHAPFWINLIRPKEETAKSVKMLQNLAVALQHMRVAYGVVTHVGALGSVSTNKAPISSEEADDNLLENLTILSKVYREMGMYLMIENTSGTKTGFPYGSVLDIQRAVRHNLPNIRSCFDTNHTIGQGLLAQGLLAQGLLAQGLFVLFVLFVLP